MLILQQLKALFPLHTDARDNPSVRLTLHRSIYFLLLFVLACAQPVSNWLMSGMEILLALNWVLEWDVRRKWQRGLQSPLLGAFLLLMLVHTLWLIGNDNLAYGINDLFKKLPLLAIPLVLLTSQPLCRRQAWFIMGCYTITVFIASLIGYVRWLTIPDLPYRDIVPYISHIRFSLNVCMAILLLSRFLYHRICLRSGEDSKPKTWLPEAVAVAMMLTLLYFLIIIRSYTGFIVLFVMTGVLLILFWKRIHGRVAKWGIMSSYLIAIVAVVLLSAYYVRDYYTLVPLSQQPLAAATQNGNPYQHKQDGLIENGNYVNNNICYSELSQEWAKVSQHHIEDTTANGYSIYATLLRYLNARGVAKDSVGMQVLTAADVAAIEKGVANPVYLEGSPLRRMAYVMLFEYESYRCLHVVKDFTMLQRFELWRNGWRVFGQHPLFGTGTGDVVDDCHNQLALDGSPLSGTKKHTHNQYLTFLITFGLVGCALLLYIFVRALRRERLCQMPLFVGYLCIVLVSFVAEDSLETLAGAVFCTFFFCFLAMTARISDAKGETAVS